MCMNLLDVYRFKKFYFTLIFCSGLQADRNQHFKSNRLFSINQAGIHKRHYSKVPLQTRYYRDSALNNGVKILPGNKELTYKRVRVRSVTSKGTDARSIERLTSDLENRIKHQSTVDDDREKRVPPTKGNKELN